MNEKSKLKTNSSEQVSLDLPLLSKSTGRIVDFSKLYQRNGRNENFVATLQELKKKLEVSAKEREKNQKKQYEEKISSESSTYNIDGHQLLVTTTGNYNEGVYLMQNTNFRQPSKPMKRFYNTSISPFERILSKRTPNITSIQYIDIQHEDAIYNKLEQIPWEKDILWGYDRHVGKKSSKDDNNYKPFVIEYDTDDERNVSKENDVKNTEDQSLLLSNGATALPSNMQLNNTNNAYNNKITSTQSAYQLQNSYMPNTTIQSKQMLGTNNSVEIEKPWVPTPQKEFDMTKPRHYRWEIIDDSTKPSRAKSVTQVSTKESTTTANGSHTARLVFPCPLNLELENGSWLNAIGWDTPMDMPESKLILDDNDSSLLFAAADLDDVRPTLRIPERKVGAAEKRLKELDEKRREKKGRIDEVMGNLDIGEGTAKGQLGTDGGGKKSKDTRVVKNIGHVHHSLPAIKLSLTKPELPKTKLREFHRPRGKFKINERLVLCPPPVIRTSSNDDKTTMIAQIKKSTDLNPTAGGKLILLEYTEQTPPMLSNPGMASRILHYWRPEGTDDQDSVSASTGKKKLIRNKPKPPEMKMGQVITLGDHDESPFVGDIPPGKVVTSLNSKLYKVPIFQHTPIAPFTSTRVQNGRQNSDSVLFLLCRSVSKSKKGSALRIDIGSSPTTTLFVMEMPDCYTAGQIEPQIEVPAPGSRSANDFIRPYMSFHILRLFKKASDGERLKIEDIARAFPNQSGTAIRKRMKEVATFERGGNDSGWWKKKPLSELTSEEEIRASIPPESVCLYESMMSGHRRLIDIGLTKLFTPTGVNGAINHLLKRLELRKQNLSTRVIEPQQLERRMKERAEEELWKRDSVIVKLEKDIQVARSIYEHLQLTPWNLTNNYVECHLQGKGSGMLQLGGIGDPTGRGEGFSFVRVPQSRAKKKDGEEDMLANATTEPNAVQKAVAAVTGTTADLRKLKMKEAGDVLRNLGLADADIKKLRRWDRIHMVRELSSRATAHGVAGSLSKFARGARKTLSAQQQEYRKKCDVIYERQMEVLSSNRTVFSSDEEEGSDDEDFDAWEKDLEAGIIGSNEGEKIAKRGPKNMFAKGGGGLSRTKEDLAAREDEVQLRQLLEDMKEVNGPSASASTASRRPDVDSNSLRTHLRATGIKDGRGYSSTGSNTGTATGTATAAASRGGSTLSSALATPTDHRSRSPSPSPSHINKPLTAGNRVSLPSGNSSSRTPGRKVLKRVTRRIEEDGSETVKIEFIVDDQQVARFNAQQQRKAQQQQNEERNLLRKRKRMLALEDPDSSRSHGGFNSSLDKEKKRKQIQDRLKQLQKSEEENKGYQEMLQKEGEGSVVVDGRNSGIIRCTQCGQEGHMRTNRSCPLYMADDIRSKRLSTALDSNEDQTKGKKTNTLGSGANGDGSTEKIPINITKLQEMARKHSAEKKRKRLMDVKAQAELYKRPYTNAVKQSRSRIPKEHLNNNLNTVIDILMEMPESELFRKPVDANHVQDYYKVIKLPMDLGTIKSRIAESKYDNMRDFVKDLEQIVTNSKSYNGDASKSFITMNATKVLKRAREELVALNAESGTPMTPRSETT